MRDDPRKNLKWLEQELLAAEQPAGLPDISEDTAQLLAQVDDLLEDPEPPVFVQKKNRPTKGERIEREHISRQFDESAAVRTKTGQQLRQEAKQRKKAEKKANTNRKIDDLVFLAFLEIIGILVILGWWLQ